MYGCFLLQIVAHEAIEARPECGFQDYIVVLKNQRTESVSFALASLLLPNMTIGMYDRLPA